MKLVGRQPVEGTTPTVYIGHRTYRDRHTRRQKVSKTWYAEYCLDAQRYYEALGTTNRAAAVKAAHAIVQRIEAGQPNSGRRRVALSELKDVYMTMQRNRGRAPKTLEKYEYVLNELVVWAEANDVRSANSFSDRDFWAFNQHMTEAGLSAKTRYDRLVIVKQCFKYAHRTKLIATNPLAGIAMDKPSSAPQPCFTPGQVATLLDKADEHEAAIFATMAYTGMRFGEVRDLRPTDLLLDQGAHGFIVVQRGGSSGTTKGRRLRRIPIHPALRDILKGLSTCSERVFTARPSAKHPAGDGPIAERRLLLSLKRLCRRCGFVDPDQYKLHTFRHAFASMCARQNISYKYALEWMGHRSSDILDLYYTMYDETAEAAIKTIDYHATGVAESRRAS